MYNAYAYNECFLVYIMIIFTYNMYNVVYLGCLKTFCDCTFTALHVADMGQYLVDLLHYLAVKDSKGVAILKFDVPYETAHTVAAFNILAAIFMKFKEIDGHGMSFSVFE